MSEREYRRIIDLPVGITPISGPELVELEQDGESRQFSMTALSGIVAEHQEKHQRGGDDEVGTLENLAYAIPYLDGDGLIDTRVSDASTTGKGKVQLATSGEVSATKAVTGTDARLSDARTPTEHAVQHIAGTDPIDTATTTVPGLMSATDKVKADATIPEYIPTEDQKAALAGTSGTPSATNEYVTNADGRLPTEDQKAALVGTSGVPSASNPFVTTTDLRLVGGGGDGTTDALVRAWASFFSVFSEEQPTGQTTRSWYGLTSHDGDLYAGVNNGDIYKMDGAGIFQPTGPTIRSWRDLASHDGDLYACVWGGDIYKMDGSGVFQPTGQAVRSWRGLTSHDGDLYAGVNTGDVYKMDGSGVFQPTGQSVRSWRGLTSHDGDLYAGVNNGDIYKMDGSGVFQPTGQTSRQWWSLASHDGDLYAGVPSGDIYKMDGSGVFQPTGQTSRQWWSLASHDGDLYAGVPSGDIYTFTTSNPSVNISKSNYTVPVSASFPINGRKVYRRTSAYDGNPVTITPPSGATFEGRASIALYGQYSYVELERISATVFAVKDLRDSPPAKEDYTVKCINHRGWHEAPENTLPAYIESKKLGYKYVECDISFTSDNVPVLLHDSTIDRTSNGTGSIEMMTYADVLQYDFGSWKDVKYTGTRITTLKEFIALCKDLSLHPYLEIKSSLTQEKMDLLYEIIQHYNMEKEVTWISFSIPSLTFVKTKDPYARLGYVSSSASAQTDIQPLKDLQTGTNEVFLDMEWVNVSYYNKTELADAKIPLEVWTVNSIDDVNSLHPYVSGITTDLLKVNILSEKRGLNSSYNLPSLTLIKTISSSELELMFLTETAPNYKNTESLRLSYTLFDIIIDTTKKYLISFTKNTESIIKLGVQAYDEYAYQQVLINESFTKIQNIVDHGWQRNGYVFDGSFVSGSGNSVKGLRVTFSKGEAEQFTGSEIVSVKIYELSNL